MALPPWSVGLTPETAIERALARAAMASAMWSLPPEAAAGAG
eukprot:CAMPEP_0197570504 /NCGR_PEP_ID=MMETSP1320-20131121/40823_1 /TAXON_ID=91990 /ORGANISM="Bolidomonas sp., Strain RCC2347" /LENGTH=41 /DNA_ID= /DNA_START= /DNA_END= /DNA_ORIENTATION=